MLAAATLAGSTFVAARTRSWADGAVAVGTTGNVVRDGIAFGAEINAPKEEATETAIQRCRTFEARAAAERCKLVVSFSGECFAVAFDPQPGTPGAGWGVGPDQLAANRKAVAMCEEAAGPARKGYCQVKSWGCDKAGQRGAVQPPAQEPGKADAKLAGEATTPPPASPLPAAEPTQAPTPNAPAKTERRQRDSRFHTDTPMFFLAVVAAVGAAYALGQRARGKLHDGIGKRQLLVGGALALGSGVIAKLMGLAGLQPTVSVAMAALLALAAAFLA
jgi:hypothetical protein